MKFICLYSLAIPLLAVTTVSNIQFDGIGDSSTRVIWDQAAIGTNVARIRYGISDCSGGTGGTVQTNGTSGGTYHKYANANNISGLAPSTTYFVCPEVSIDGGSTYSSGISATFTTLARTQTLPIAPTPVPHTYPVQTGTVRNVLSDCSNLQSQINAAVPGDTIIVPAGTICTGAYTLPDASDKHTFSVLQTSDSRITATSHGLAENSEIRLSTTGCLPGNRFFNSVLNCGLGGGWRKGQRFFIHVIDANTLQLLDTPSGSPIIPGWLHFTADTTADTLTFLPTYQVQQNGFTPIAANFKIQFHTTGTLPAPLTVNTDYYLLNSCATDPNAACVTQVSATSGGAAINLTTTGTGVHTFVDVGTGTQYYISAPLPPGSGQDFLLTSDGTLPAPGIRITSASDTQMFHFRQTVTTLTNSSRRLQTGILTHSWHIVGAIFDSLGNDTAYTTETDPNPYCIGIGVGQEASNIIFDRVRVQGPGYPWRMGCPSSATAIFLDGFNVGFINSDLRGMDYWHTWTTTTGAFAVTTGSTTATFAPGSIGTGSSYCNFVTTTSNLVVTITAGSASNNAVVYLGRDCHIKVLPPTGITLTCTGGSGAICDVLGAVGSPAYPTDGSGRATGIQIGTIAISGSNVASASLGDPSAAVNAPEGTQAIIAGNGPGPYILDNNFISGTGISVHFDDSGSWFNVRGDYNVTRNTWDSPVTQQAGGAMSDGLRYFTRGMLEWKAGERGLISQNTFLHNWAEDASCVFVNVKPNFSYQINDIDVSNNQFLDLCGGFVLGLAVDSAQPQSKPFHRGSLANNHINPNGNTYKIPFGLGYGWFAEIGYGSEDLLFDHNTMYNPQGSSPAFLHVVLNPIGGMTITNNIYSYTGSAPGIQQEGAIPNGTGSCAAADKALMDCSFTSGPGNPSYTFSGNVIIPSWANATALTGFVGTSTVTTAYGALTATNPVPLVGTQAGNLSYVNFNGLGLDSASPYYSSPCTLPCGYIVLAAPTSLSAIPGNTQVSLSWTASAGVGVTYNIYRGTLATGESVTPIATGISSTSYLNTGLSNGTTYYYTIAAISGPATSLQSSEINSTPFTPTTGSALSFLGGVHSSGKVIH